MDISSIGTASPSSFASASSSPMATLLQAQATTDASLFGNVSGEPSDLSSLASTVAAYSMYTDPALLMQLTQWDGSQTPGSQRVAATPENGAAPVTPQYSFNPFDESSWWTDPSGSNVDTTA